MLKILIIAFLCVFATVDIIIAVPKIKKYLKKKQRKKKQKIFANKMKQLEIK